MDKETIIKAREGDDLAYKRAVYEASLLARRAFIDRKNYTLSMFETFDDAVNTFVATRAQYAVNGYDVSGNVKYSHYVYRCAINFLHEHYKNNVLCKKRTTHIVTEPVGMAIDMEQIIGKCEATQEDRIDIKIMMEALDKLDPFYSNPIRAVYGMHPYDKEKTGRERARQLGFKSYQTMNARHKTGLEKLRKILIQEDK